MVRWSISVCERIANTSEFGIHLILGLHIGVKADTAMVWLVNFSNSDALPCSSLRFLNLVMR